MRAHSEEFNGTFGNLFKIGCLSYSNAFVELIMVPRDNINLGCYFYLLFNYQSKLIFYAKCWTIKHNSI